MRPSFAVLAVALAAPAMAHADSQVMTEQVAAAWPGIGGYAAMEQRGDGNMASIDQQPGARASVSQVGNGNMVELRQGAGSGVTSSQIGDGLGYGMQQSANAGQVAITQHR